MKGSDIKTIWQVPVFLSYVQPTLTDETIAAAEKKIGYKLPKEYLDILKIQNGGYIRFTLEEMATHSVIAGIGPYFPSITEFDWFHEWQPYVSFDLKGLFPFDVDGRFNICLDYRRNKIEPEITYVGMESNVQEHIAANFKEYLSLLKLETQNELVVETDVALEEAVAQIATITNIQFNEPDADAHGYPTYSGYFNGALVWIYANKVPKAFARADDERYEELKSQMHGTALMYPEIPGGALFISSWEDEARIELGEELKRHGFVIKPVSSYL